MHIGLHLFVGQHLRQVLNDGLRRHGAQIELQTTRQHSDRYFVRIGGGQHKLQILGRLFQGFEHGIERGVAEHVHLVNHEDFEAPLHRLVSGLFEQLLHLIHASVRCRVQFGVINKSACINVYAGRTHATRLVCDASFTVQGLGQNTRHRGFAHAACAGEQIRMVQTL